MIDIEMQDLGEVKAKRDIIPDEGFQTTTSSNGESCKEFRKSYGTAQMVTMKAIKLPSLKLRS